MDMGMWEFEDLKGAGIYREGWEGGKGEKPWE